MPTSENCFEGARQCDRRIYQLGITFARYDFTPQYGGWARQARVRLLSVRQFWMIRLSEYNDARGNARSVFRRIRFFCCVAILRVWTHYPVRLAILPYATGHVTPMRMATLPRRF